MTILTASRPTPTGAPASASLRIDRVAGLAVERVALGLAEADALAARLDDLEQLLLAEGERAGDALHALVPLLDDDRALRRTALAVRRRTRSEAPGPDERIDALLVALSAHGIDPSPLRQWAALAAEHAALAVEYSAAVSTGVAAASRRLEALREDPELLTAIADASPDFAAAPGRDPLLPGRHAGRSLLAYAGRAARKTSPFGTLTTVGLAGDPAPRASTVAVTHAYAAAWLDVLARDERAAHAFEVEPLDTGGLDPASEPVGVPALLESPDVVWRRTLRVPLRGGVLERLQPLGRVPLRVLLDAIGGDDPFASYVRFLDSGLLRVVAPWSYGERGGLDALAACLSVSAPAHPATALLTGIAADARRVTALEGRERGRARAAVRDRAEQSLRAAGADPARSRFEVYVDAAPSAPVADPPPGIRSELERYRASLGRLVRRSPAYDALVAAFVAAHGVGGTAPSAWRWLLAAGSDEALTTALATARLRASDGPDERPRGRSMPRPSAALAVQIAHGDEPLLVVNQLLGGQGGLVSRFAPLHAGLAPRLAARAHRLAAGALPLEIVPSWDVNGMQSAASGILPRLRLPVDQPVAGAPSGDVDLADIALHHDPVSDSLELLAPGGRAIALFYLGLVPSHLHSGVERLLTVLADPWLLPRAGAPAFASLADAEQVVATPRRVNGSIVTRRATWSVPRAALPAPTEDDAELLRSFGRWRRSHSLPDEVFVRCVRQHFPGDPVSRKPVPVDLRSPHALRMLAALVTPDVAGLEITEALPAAGQLGHVDDEGGHRAVEHLLLLEWDR